MTFHQIRRAVSFTFAAAFVVLVSPIQADTFSYQGKLTESGQPVAGPLNLAFRLYDDEVAGVQVGPELELLGFTDFGDNGEFIADLDFGAAAFPGTDRWLEVWIDGAPLTPRQPVNPTPYAMYAETAAGVIDGGLPGTYGNPVDFTNAANTFMGTFDGSGAALTNLSASAIASGTIAASHLPNGGAWSLSSLLVIDSGTLSVDATANAVGIGTSNPSSRLTVSRSVQAQDHQLELRNEGSIQSPNFDGIKWTQGTTGSTKLASIDVLYRNSGNPDMAFNLRSAANIMHLDALGTVGIGSTNPEGKLHVSSDNDPTLILSSQSTLGQDTGMVIRGARNATTTASAAFIDLANFDSDEGAGTDYVMARVSGGMADVSGGTGDLRFFTNPGGGISEGMRLDKNGNLGLGTTSPAERLDVAGDLRIVSNSDVTAAFGSGALHIRNTAGDFGLHLDANEIQSLGTDLRINFDNQTNTNINETLFVKASGQVGIGIQSPLGLLHVNGAPGDDQVRLPGDAINRDEIIDEPGLSSANDTTPDDVNTNAIFNLVSKSIDCPSGGFVVAMATAYVAHGLVSPGWCEVSLSTSASTMPSANRYGFGPAEISDSFTIHTVFPVTAGLSTFHLNTEGADGLDFLNIRLTLMYFPTSYGTVQ